MAALGRMASGIAHEIRNPLEIIYMGVDCLENNIHDDNPVVRESIDKIFNAISRSDNIINNVLSFSRQTPFEIRQIRICSLLDKLLELAKPFMKYGIDVHHQYDDDSLEVAGDQILEQVFLNLINNAVDAMKESEQKILTIRVYKKLITDIGYKTGNRYTDYFRIGDYKVVVEVSDTGKGIPKDVMSKIFEPFFTTKAVNEGTGLGLSIVHSILERMQGTIDVQSMENIGTTFLVNLQPQIKVAYMKEENYGREIQSTVH
jgi:signal transduction histidine kinase